jgi:hypothetical protein
MPTQRFPPLSFAWWGFLSMIKLKTMEELK